MKDLYLYFTDLNYLEEFRSLTNFISPFEYDPTEFKNIPPDEFGKIIMKIGCSVHLIYDNGISDKCPWCGFKEVEIIEDPFIPTTFSDEKWFYVKCQTCKSRGPLKQLFIHDSSLLTKQYVDSMLILRWKTRQTKSQENKNGF